MKDPKSSMIQEDIKVELPVKHKLFIAESPVLLTFRPKREC